MTLLPVTRARATKPGTLGRAGIVLAGMLAGALGLSAFPAYADDDVVAAKKLFQDAVDAAKKNDHRAAAELYEEADRRAPRANAVFNAGQQWDAAGDTQRAADSFATALERGGLDANVYAVAAGRLKELEAGLDQAMGSILVTEPRGGLATVARESRRPIPMRAYIPAGEAVITIERADGKITSYRVTIQPRQETTFTPKEPSEPPSQPPSIPPHPVEPSLAPSSTSPITASPSASPASTRSSWKGPLGWTSLATGVAAAGVGIGLGVHGRSVRDQWDASGHTPSQINLYNSAIALRTWSNVALGGAVVFGGLGITLLILSTAPKSPASTPAKVTVGLGVAPASVGLSATF